MPRLHSPPTPSRHSGRSLTVDVNLITFSSYAHREKTKHNLTMKSVLILGLTERLFQEIEAAQPTPGYFATTAIDWTNWGVTEANDLSWGNAGNGGNDATTAYSIINLHDLNWTTDSPPVENDKPTSFDSLVATTGASLEDILATTELMMPQFTTESPKKVFKIFNFFLNSRSCCLHD